MNARRFVRKYLKWRKWTDRELVDLAKVHVKNTEGSPSNWVNSMMGVLRWKDRTSSRHSDVFPSRQSFSADINVSVTQVSVVQICKESENCHMWSGRVGHLVVCCGRQYSFRVLGYWPSWEWSRGWRKVQVHGFQFCGTKKQRSALISNSSGGLGSSRQTAEIVNIMNVIRRKKNEKTMCALI